MTSSGLTFRREKPNGSRLYDCPECGGEGKLEYTPDSRVWFCHKCQEWGWGEVKGWCREKREWIREELKHPVREIDSLLDSFQLIQSVQDHRYRYLSRGRKLRSFQINHLRPHTGPQWNFVFFPIYKLGGGARPVYFIGRNITDEEPKYYNPPLEWFPEGGKSRNLWGLHRIPLLGTTPSGAKSGIQTLVLCEGIFDAVWENNSVALLGKSISNEQIEIIREIDPKEIVIYLDGEARREALKVAYALSEKLSQKIYTSFLPFGSDPNNWAIKGKLRPSSERVA